MSQPVKYADKFRCTRKLTAGEVKRCLYGAQFLLVGYYVCCPWCSWTQIILDDEHHFTEEGTETPKKLVAMQLASNCERCHHRIAIEGEAFLD